MPVVIVILIVINLYSIALIGGCTADIRCTSCLYQLHWENWAVLVVCTVLVISVAADDNISCSGKIGCTREMHCAGNISRTGKIGCTSNMNCGGNQVFW